MAIENEELMRMSRESLKGKWGLAIGTFVVYLILSMALGCIPKIGAVFSLLITGPLMLGLATFSLAISRNQDARLEQIFDGFNYYTKALSTYLLMAVIVFLWTLLLIIPGIIAALSYSMTFYILADDRSIEPMAALEKSKKMMDGYKMKLFILGLWFFLLGLACLLTCGIGFLWFLPFAHVTTAKFYDDIKGDPDVVVAE